MTGSHCHWYPLCPMRRFFKKGLLPYEWIDAYCKGDWHQCVRYRLEAEGRYHPDWMLPDGSLDISLKGH
jgi:DNA polymerase